MLAQLLNRIRLGRDERGQFMVEFALLLPVFLMLLFGIVEFGAAWRTSQVLTNSAREGARVAILASSTADSVRNIVRSRLTAGGLNPDDSSITLNLCSGSGCTGQSDEVEVSYPHRFVVLGPLVGLWGEGGGVITLRSRSVMRNE